MAIYRVFKKRNGKFDVSAVLSTKAGIVKRSIAKDVTLTELAVVTRGLADEMQVGRENSGLAVAGPSKPGLV